MDLRTAEIASGVGRTPWRRSGLFVMAGAAAGGRANDFTAISPLSGSLRSAIVLITLPAIRAQESAEGATTGAFVISAISPGLSN